MLTKQQIIALAVEAELAEVTDTADSLPVEYVEALVKFAELVSAKETQSRQAAQLELEQYRNEAQQRAGVLIKEAYQRGVRDERNACLSEIETGIWMDKTTEEVLAEIADAIRARSAE